MFTENSSLFDWEAKFVRYLIPDMRHSRTSAEAGSASKSAGPLWSDAGAEATKGLKPEAQLSSDGWVAAGAQHNTADGISGDGAHDLAHFRRVWKAAAWINREEGGVADDLILLAAAYFHDVVSLPKNDPRRGESSRLSAEKAARLLEEEFVGFPREKIAGICHAILAHSFSAGIAPGTPEARILQDADRLEAVGAIGVARVFYIAGQLGTQLFDAGDPLAAARELDDRRFALDHFAVKLLKLPAMMHTAAARRLAEKNAAWMRLFMEKLCSEIDGDYHI